MLTADRIWKGIRRTATTLILATAYLASGYSAEAATNARGYGEGVVLVARSSLGNPPPTSSVARSSPFPAATHRARS
ncbi:MAG: hypothetical protein AB7F76_16580 [Parvibaculaceae bacterium]